jgi:Calcineurin-like phosphoesterase
VRTAIVSDLHLGSVSGEDVARDAAIRRALLEEVAAADRLVLLGDAVELREQPLGAALAAARPFFEELGEALAGREVVLVPGNHDHRFAEPLLDDLSLAGGPALGLEHRFDPSPGPTAQLQRWLGGARLSLAYPGIWLREDVYATHGHYMDCHLPLPRAECVAAAAAARSNPLPATATPADYERVLRPIYGFSFGRAQSRRAVRLSTAADRPSEAAWKLLSGSPDGDGAARRIAGSALRAGLPATIWALNRLLRSSFDPDFSSAAILRGGLDATAELARRLGVDSAHVITGHTHRGGPYEGDGEWRLPGGGHIHNTGSWVFATAFHHPGRPPSPYWPGTVTWVEGSEAPRRLQLLRDRSHAELTEAVALSLAAASATPR